MVNFRSYLKSLVSQYSVTPNTRVGENRITHLKTDFRQTPQPDVRIDSQMQAIIDQLAALGGKPIETLSADEARQQPTPADAVAALLEEQGASTAPEPVARIENRRIAGPGGDIPIRIYWPEGTGPFPVIVYFHGGGWVIGDLDTYDSTPRALANAAQAIVVSSHYRQAPEHKFPAAHEDTFAAYEWTIANAASIGGDPARVAVAGESAGGNMAASAALRARDQNVQLPVYQVLIYPVTNAALDTSSQQENRHAKPLNLAMLSWFYEKYLNGPEDAANPKFSLLLTDDLGGLPPATVITAEMDPLRSEGEAYAQRLREAGVVVDYQNYKGVTHEFFGMGAALYQARQAVEQTATALRRAFSLVS